METFVYFVGKNIPKYWEPSSSFCARKTLLVIQGNVVRQKRLRKKGEDESHRRKSERLRKEVGRSQKGRMYSKA
jgi:hypothetical protein